MTSDPWVLSVVRFGYRLEFTATPPRSSAVRVTEIPQETVKREALLEELRELLAKNAIVQVQGPSLPGFFLHLLSDPEEVRSVEADLEFEASQCIYASSPLPHGDPEGHLVGTSSGFMGVSLDLKDAYLHIPMHYSARRWLRFNINRASYEFRVLPFGLSTAPRTFTRVVKTVAEYLRCRGVRIFVYLDDWLVVAPSRKLLQEDLRRVCELTSRLGFIINYEKPCLVPDQRVTYLGAVLDFAQGRVFPTEERIMTVTQCARALLTREVAEARVFLRMLGLMASLIDVLPLCRMRMRPLQLHFLQHFRSWIHPLCHLIPVPPGLHQSLSWWSNPINFRLGMVFFPTPSPSITLTTDASKQGWGAHIMHHQVTGRWSAAQARSHINILELWAVHLALRHLSRLV